jgi:hypothetical protein
VTQVVKRLPRKREALSTTKKKKALCKPNVVSHACNPDTGETEAGGSRISGKPELHRETLSQKKK